MRILTSTACFVFLLSLFTLAYAQTENSSVPEIGGLNDPEYQGSIGIATETHPEGDPTQDMGGVFVESADAVGDEVKSWF